MHFATSSLRGRPRPRSIHLATLAILVVCWATSCIADELHVAIQQGNVAALKSLIEKDPSLVDVNVTKDATGRPLNNAVRCNNYEITELLLKNGADVNAKGGWYKRTPIEEATSARMAILLAEYGADLSVNSGSEQNPETLLQDAASRDRVELAQAYADLGIPVDLDSAVKLGWTDRVREQLRASPQTTLELSRLLCHAADKGRLDTCKMLIAKGADPSKDYGFANIAGPYTALSEAVTANQFEAAKYLCEQGANPDVSGGRGQDILLHRAIAFQELRYVQLLLDHGANVNREAWGGKKSLHIACSLGTVDDVTRGYMVGQPQDELYEHSRIMAIARLLISHGADVNAATSEGATPLLYAAITRNKELCDLLIDNGARPSLNYACALGDLALATELLDSATLPDALTARTLDRTHLHWAVRSGNVHLAKELLRRGADSNATAAEMSSIDGHAISVDGVDDFDSTLLHFAARTGSRQMIDLLVEHGAKVDKENEHGWTPLMEGVYHDNIESVSALIVHGADVNHRASMGSSPTILAAAKPKMLTALIQAGAAVDHVVESGENALSFAAEQKQFECVEILENHGVEVIDVETACMLDRPSNVAAFVQAARNNDDYKNGTDKDLKKFEIEKHPWLIRTAAEYGSVRAIDALIINGASYLAEDLTPASPPFHAAAEYGHVKVLQYFLDLGMPVDARSGYHATALHDAMENAQTEAAEFLIQNGADVNAVDGQGYSALHHVIQDRFGLHDINKRPNRQSRERQLGLIQLLIERGANVDHRNGAGMTPLHLACLWGQTEIAKALLENGASLEARTSDGETVVSLAEREHQTTFDKAPNKRKLVVYLKSLGAR